MIGLSVWHILLFLLIVILLFGTSKIKSLGRDIGGAIKDFKDSVKDDEKNKEEINEGKTIINLPLDNMQKNSTEKK